MSKIEYHQIALNVHQSCCQSPPNDGDARVSLIETAIRSACAQREDEVRAEWNQQAEKEFLEHGQLQARIDSLEKAQEDTTRILQRNINSGKILE